MSTDLVVDLTIFILSLLVGFEVISKVPATLHTPLMSGANSIHGIVVVGAMLSPRPHTASPGTCSRSWPWPSPPPTWSAGTR